MTSATRVASDAGTECDSWGLLKSHTVDRKRNKRNKKENKKQKEREESQQILHLESDSDLNPPNPLDSSLLPFPATSPTAPSLLTLGQLFHTLASKATNPLEDAYGDEFFTRSSSTFDALCHSFREDCHGDDISTRSFSTFDTFCHSFREDSHGDEVFTRSSSTSGAFDTFCHAACNFGSSLQSLHLPFQLPPITFSITDNWPLAHGPNPMDPSPMGVMNSP